MFLLNKYWTILVCYANGDLKDVTLHKECEYNNSPTQRILTFLLHWNLFWLSIMSLTESFNPPKHTPLYEIKQNEREILQSAFGRDFKVLIIDYDSRVCWIWGQSYKDFYTLGQIYNCVLKHENNALAQAFVFHTVRTQHPNKFVGLHFSILLKRPFRHFILHHPKV